MSDHSTPIWKQVKTFKNNKTNQGKSVNGKSVMKVCLLEVVTSFIQYTEKGGTSKKVFDK